MKLAFPLQIIATGLLCAPGVDSFLVSTSIHSNVAKVGSAELRDSGTDQGVTALYSLSTKEPELEIFSGTKNVVEIVPLNLLSFDGGGIKGAMSTRILAFTLQRLMEHGESPSPNPWTRSLVEYIKSFEESYQVLWTVWAQQMDSLGVEPQVLGDDGSRKKEKWMDFSFDDEDERKMIEAILKVDLAYEFYLAHVLSISGTSTGGLISLATIMRMSLTQIAALYMDPKTANIIFPKPLNPFRLGGWLQAKYTQDGVRKVVDRIIKEVSPFPKDERPSLDRKFVDTVDEYNQCLKARLMGRLHDNEKNRMAHTLGTAQKRHPKKLGTDDTWVDRQVSLYESNVKEASKFLIGAKMKRFRKIIGGRKDGEKNMKSLEKLNLKQPSARYDETFFSTRCLITSRCVNNGAAVIFDSHEPIGTKDEPMTARGALKIGDENLDVSTLTVADVCLCTSAAPYFFPAHQINKFFFHDGGVIANDPGLIGLCYAYGRFGESIFDGKAKSSFPVFKLFRVGCGIEEEYLNSPIKKTTPQGAVIVTKLADMFMNGASHRTDLLASVLGEKSILEETKLDATVPTHTEDHSLPMDKIETLDLINALFAEIDPDLEHTIVISEKALNESLSKGKVGDLTDSIIESASFLQECEKSDKISLDGPQEAMKLMCRTGLPGGLHP